MRKAHKIYLFLNRNCMVFDEAGQQILEYQRVMGCYRLNKKLAMQATQEANEFYIATLQDRFEPIDRKSMQYLLGLRTKAMDIAEMGEP